MHPRSHQLPGKPSVCGKRSRSNRPRQHLLHSSTCQVRSDTTDCIVPKEICLDPYSLISACNEFLKRLYDFKNKTTVSTTLQSSSGSNNHGDGFTFEKENVLSQCRIISEELVFGWWSHFTRVLPSMVFSPTWHSYRYLYYYSV